MEKRIEEIDELTTVLYEANHKKSVLDYRWLATEAYNAGYRKQSEGEWKQKEFWDGGGTWRCTECKRQIMFLHGTPKTENMNFCPGCGARMKGERDEG